jgi:hypothetical protein
VSVSHARAPCQLAHNGKEWGFDTHLGAFHFGTLPHELTVKSLRLYAEDVIPYLRNGNNPAAVPNAVHEGATGVAPP